MAIQNRRGNAINLDTNKLLPGEFAVSIDERKVEVCFAPGDTKKMVTQEDVQNDIQEANQALIDELTAGINTATTNANNATSAANTATTNATNATSAANTAVTNANNAISAANVAKDAANTATANANNATTSANNAATNANNVATDLTNETLIIWKPYVATYNNIATTYPNPIKGWTTQAQDTGIRWRYNGSTWANIGLDPVDKVGDTTQLPTTDKSNIVNSIKEVSGQLDSIENQMDVLEATLSHDYKSIFSAGTGKDNTLVEQNFNNKVEGQSDIKIEGLTENNAITNGDFANGTTGWTSSTESLSVANNILSATITSQSYGDVKQVTNIVCTLNKKVFVSAKVKVTNANANKLCIKYYGTVSGGAAGTGSLAQATPVSNQQYVLNGIITIPSGFSGNLRIQIIQEYVDAATALNKVIQIQDVTVKDLAALGLDTLTLDQLNFMNDHYINGLQGTGSHKIVSVGKNNIPTSSIEWEQGNINADGVLSSTTTRLRMKNYYPIKPNTQYITKSLGSYAYSFRFYDINKNFISYITSSPFTTPLNARYFKVVIVKDDIAILTTDLISTFQLQLEVGPVSSDCEPYQSAELNIRLPDGVQMHRIPNRTPDSIENMNDVPTLFIRNKKIVFNGTENWTYDASLDGANYSTFYTNCADKTTKVMGAIISDKFLMSSNVVLASAENEGIWEASNYQVIYIRIAKTKLATVDVTGFKAWLTANNVVVVYELDTPIIYKNGENGFSVTGNLEVFKGGTIYVEPVSSKQCTNPKTYISYNLSQKAVITENSGGITAINKRMSDWKTINPWITPTLLNGWVAYDTLRIPKYYKDVFGIVHLCGNVKNGTTTSNTIIFTIPQDYAPTSPRDFPITTSTSFTFGAIVVDSDGTVKIRSANSTFLSLDGITFKAGA